jgi:hypothetical protein
MKRDFQLPEDDSDYLNSLGLKWETVNDSRMNWVIIYDYPVISGYNVDYVNVAIKIEVGYPRSPLDMAYFYPHLTRKDGKPIGAITSQNIGDKTYQRWSRHRTATNPWRDGVDDISSHMTLVTFWFEQEFIKRPNEIPA